MNIKYILSHPIQYQSPLIKFLNKNNKIINIPFKFSDTGSEIIFKE